MKLTSQIFAIVATGRRGGSSAAISPAEKHEVLALH
jgi:hypothetical protein